MLDSLEAKERLKNLMTLLLGEVKGSLLTDLGVRTIEELGIVPMTRAEMSRRLGVSETAIGLWRSARVGKISPDNMEKLANLAGRNGSELVLYIKGEVDLKSFLNKEKTIRSLAEILAEIKQRPMSELPEIIMTATATMQQHMAANEKTLAGEIRSWMRLNRVSQIRLESMLTKSIPPVPPDRLRRILGGDTPSDGELGAIAIILGWGDKADIDELREIYGLKEDPKKTHPNQAVAC